MRVFTIAEKLKAIKLYIKYDFSPGAVIYELGYPANRSVLYRWYKVYQDNGNKFPKRSKQVRSKYTEEQKKAAIEYYLTHGKSVKKTIMALGYPGSTCLCDWLNELVPKKIRKWHCKKDNNVVRCTQEQKCQAILEYMSGNKSAKQISEELDIGKETIYSWKNKYLGRRKEIIKEKAIETSIQDCALTESEEVHNLQEQVVKLKQQEIALHKEIYRLQLEKDVLSKAAEIIKKGNGINLATLNNREKAMVINALREIYPLKELLVVLNMAKSSYCYRQLTMYKDKYKELRIRVRKEFAKSNNRYGYRRIHAVICSNALKISEKVIRRIMKEEKLNVLNIKVRKYSSYKGEISPEVDNIVARNFHANKPNEKWLTDITEFHIPAGKVYLSPIIDCYDGMPVTWTIGTSPCAELVNSMLDSGISQLKPWEHPLIHTDRGCHYRWPGWIERMEKAGLTRSMSKKGCSPDNAACEGFFGHVKNEMFYGISWIGVSVDDFMKQLDDYLHWYVEERIKISLGGLSPMQYRAKLGIS